MIARDTPVVQDSKQQFRDIQSGVLALKLSVAATMTDETVRVWQDSYELVKYLLDFDQIVTFNGERFDMPLLVADIIKNINPDITDPQVIIEQDDFYKLYVELYNRSYDLYSVTKQASGSIFSLANIAEATLKFTRAHTIVTATEYLRMNNFLGAVNFALEGASLVYNLRYVGKQLKKLAAKGPDDRVITFDV